MTRADVQHRSELMRELRSLTGLTMSELFRLSTVELERRLADIKAGGPLPAVQPPPPKPTIGKPNPALQQNNPAPPPGVMQPPPPPPTPVAKLPTQNAAPVPVSSDPLAQAMAAAIQPYLATKTDEDQVKALINDAFTRFTQTYKPPKSLDEDRVKELIDEARIPKQLDVVVKDKSGKTIATVSGAHVQFPRLLQHCQHRFNVWVWGKPGGGKSTAAKQVADALALRFGAIQLNMQTPESRLFGFIPPTGQGVVRTSFRECYEHGGVFLIDEIDNANDGLLTTLNTALANNFHTFPDAQVDRHEDFICIASANTGGKGGGSQHAGRRPVDGATLDRFVTMYWEYDLALEERVTLAINPTDGLKWLGWVRAVRKFIEDSKIDVTVSPRASFHGAELLSYDDKQDTTVQLIADEVLFNKGWKPDQISRVLQNCPLPSIPGRRAK